mmetsp:Transcript_7369/g.13583  ORF Transcript_7369/g.13583 Transcript_7369/m.13583 type:complete len:92 (-) Transcript_7369:1068-1343(-)
MVGSSDEGRGDDDPQDAAEVDDSYDNHFGMEEEGGLQACCRKVDGKEDNYQDDSHSGGPYNEVHLATLYAHSNPPLVVLSWVQTQTLNEVE